MPPALDGIVERPDYFVAPTIITGLGDGVAEIVLTVRIGERDRADFMMEVMKAISQLLAQ